jgi:hypothetical protein
VFGQIVFYSLWYLVKLIIVESTSDYLSVDQSLCRLTITNFFLVVLGIELRTLEHAATKLYPQLFMANLKFLIAFLLLLKMYLSIFLLSLNIYLKNIGKGWVQWFTPVIIIIWDLRPAWTKRWWDPHLNQQKLDTVVCACHPIYVGSLNKVQAGPGINAKAYSKTI